MEWTEYLRFVMAFIFVMALMGGFYLIVKRLGLNGVQRPGSKKRLRIAEVIVLDSRHKAVLLQRDNKEHLVILSPTGETVVETGIEASLKSQAHDQNPG